MSEHAARSAIMRMHHREVAVAADYAAGLSADLHKLSIADPEREQAAFMSRREELCAAYGMPVQSQTKPFAFSNGLAIIPVHGTLINRFAYSWSYVTGYNFIRQQVDMAGQDPDVKAIVFDGNSYGGEAAGCFECAADIPQLARGKPTMFVVDSNCYSACYALASQCDRIVVTPSGGAGSIGVVAMHVSMEKMLDEWGIKVTFIHAGKHKVDGNPFEDLPDSVRADMQKSVDKSYGAFVALVASGRDMDEKAVRATEARIYRAEDAMSLGLIDAVATPQAAVQAFMGELSGSNQQSRKEDAMSDAAKPGATTTATPEEIAKAQADAQKAERARVSGITTCEEAKGREKLANHLAFNTNLSVDEAKAMLAVAPKETSTESAGANPLQQAMAATKNPEVGSEAASGVEEGASPVGGILAAARLAGVRGFEKAEKSA